MENQLLDEPTELNLLHRAKVGDFAAFQQYAKQLRQQMTHAIIVSAAVWYLGSLTHAQSPAASEFDGGTLAAVVQLGETIVENTTTNLISKDYVHNALNCKRLQRLKIHQRYHHMDLLNLLEPFFDTSNWSRHCCFEINYK